MFLTPEDWIMILSGIMDVLLLLFVVDWRYFRDWIVIYLFTCNLSFILGSPIVNFHLIEYPYRLLPDYYQTCIFFELLIFPTLCIFYNQITRNRDIWSILYYAILFSAGMTACEYPLELYTNLIKYINWSWLTTFSTLLATFLLSRTFIAFCRWGCCYFGGRNINY